MRVRHGGRVRAHRLGLLLRDPQQRASTTTTARTTLRRRSLQLINLSVDRGFLGMVMGILVMGWVVMVAECTLVVGRTAGQ